MARLARRTLVVLSTMVAVLVAAPVAALACGGLIAPGHAEVLRKATTMAAWHDGLEHYVTGFQFAGSASSFGYIIPLPGVPTKIQKAGDWTLERLEQEINPEEFAFADSVEAAPTALRAVEVIQRVKVDALDIVVVRGGGPDVAEWAGKNGFDLTPDTPAVLRGYSDQGAVFALAKFDSLAATKKGLVEGQGTVIHFTIPTPAPWVPLKILGLGKHESEIVDADLFILTDRRPDLEPAVADYPGMEVRSSAPASESLLSDLRGDRGMRWLPERGLWLTALTLHTPARTIQADLSIDGGGPPLALAADRGVTWPSGWWVALLALGAVAVGAAAVGRQSKGGATPRPA
jgi:Uncharacterized protein conserved in bacteria (DUF2330)